MSHKVVSVAAGEAHTLVLTADGSLFSWGRGTFGRLGTSKEDDELFPVPIASSDSSNVSQANYIGIATGAYHNLGLRDDGSVWSWGYNVYGQLGHDKENCSIPCLVEHFKGLDSPDSLPDASNAASTDASLKICTVKAGGMMSLAIDNHGSLWIWGNSPQATEHGQFCLSNSVVPLPVWHFHGHTVVKVACGNEHVVAVVSTGETYNGGNGDLVCYAWGNNKHGQLGLGDKESRSQPEIVSTFDEESPWVVYEVACGAYHTAILANKKSYDQEIESKCWTCGLGENGQLGHGTTQSSCVPRPLDSLPQDAFLISLDCGLFHTSVVSSTGEVWSWGMEKGLGLCPDASFTGTDAGDAHLPLRIRAPEVNGIRFTGPVQVACGAAHTVLVSDNGYKLWAWGRGRSGVLGTGLTTDSYAPSPVLWPPVEMTAKKGSNSRDSMPKTRDNEVGKLQETDQKLSAATEELNFLRTKLTLMERYANLLHISIFRKPLDERRLSQSLQESGVFDIRKELEGVLEKADDEELTRMEMFYRGMLSTVKEKLMKRRVKELVKECLSELATGRQHSSS
ncbi:ultraviolet-B receptor UVR8-like [Zingiber officinale]|uniref:ultraviolet-B receptor UVR8-like n=1 Tax=Zingiber officinale TaxID=94328 RepID=UPI001C4D6FBE|nr:ultraviolet-B receptor UVR8-like [Zingiber officinale]